MLFLEPAGAITSTAHHQCITIGLGLCQVELLWGFLLFESPAGSAFACPVSDNSDVIPAQTHSLGELTARDASIMRDPYTLTGYQLVGNYNQCQRSGSHAHRPRSSCAGPYQKHAHITHQSTNSPRCYQYIARTASSHESCDPPYSAADEGAVVPRYAGRNSSTPSFNCAISFTSDVNLLFFASSVR